MSSLTLISRSFTVQPTVRSLEIPFLLRLKEALMNPVFCILLGKIALFSLSPV